MIPNSAMVKALSELVKAAREADDTFLAYLLMMALQEVQNRVRKDSVN